MKKIQIAFYKNVNNTRIDKSIYLFQKTFTVSKPYCKYTHCEIIIDDCWYSSSFMDGGVRKKKITPNRNNWDFIDIEINDNEVTKIKRLFERELNKKYDLLNIFFTQVFKFGIQNNNKWICSEICAHALQLANVLGTNVAYSDYCPGTLAKEIIIKKVKRML